MPNATSRLARRVALALSFTLAGAAPVAAQARDEPRPLSGPRVAAQIGTGVVLTPIAFFGTAWVVDRLTERKGEDRQPSIGPYVAVYTAAWLAAASGPAVVGRDGQYAAALGGALAGMGGSVIAVKLGNMGFDGGRRCNVICWSLGALAVSLPSIGATIAYNASR